jgi:EKC/KEOPS complex subunit CGI121/TPRKB
MANLLTLHLAHLPLDLAVHVALFTHLENASFLRQQLLDGNADYEYALIDARVV